MTRPPRRAARTDDELACTLSAARAARTAVLSRYGNREIVDALASAASAWLDPAFAPRRHVTEALADELSMAPDMLARGLDHLFAAVNSDALGRLIKAEADPPQALERAIAGAGDRHLRLLGPPIVVHLLAGNVPGLAVAPIVACMLARSVCVIRDSRRQPLLTGAFVDTLAERAPELAACVVVVEPRLDLDVLDRLMPTGASRIEISGSDETVAALAARYPGRSVVERGTRLSLGLVPDTEEPARFAGGFAEDVVLYEGRGCLTPHAIVVEGHARRAARMAESLAAGLARLETRWPRRRASLASEVERRRFIDDAELSALAHSDARLLRGKEDAWCVHLDPRAALRVGPGQRCVTVIPAGDRDRLLTLLEQCDAPLAGVGVAGLGAAGLGGSDGQPPDATLADSLRRLGATWVCTPGRMQAPPVAWQQDGRRRLGDLLAWREVEPQPAP